jgi:hypothetical protein
MSRSPTEFRLKVSYKQTYRVETDDSATDAVLRVYQTCWNTTPENKQPDRG